MATSGSTKRTNWLDDVLRENCPQQELLNGVLDVLGRNAAPGADTSRRFEGWYGQAYSAVMREPVLRRPLFGMVGAGSAIQDLEMLVQRIASETDASELPLLDVPCGQGVVAELLGKARWAGRYLGIDLALVATNRAMQVARKLPPSIDARILRGTALDLPLREDSVTGIVSLNGLHVMPDHATFLAELARVLRPGGSIWLVTILTDSSKRTEYLVRSAKRLGVMSVAPPTRRQLETLLASVGLEVADDFSGRSQSPFVGLRIVHRRG